jgi:ABC-2 type transport system permease protein
VTHAVRAELLKLRTTRTAMGFLIAIVVLTLGLGALIFTETRFDDKQDVKDALAGTGVASTLLLVLGIVGTTGEHRHGTISSSLLVIPDRAVLVASKLAAYALVGMVLGAAAMAVTMALGIPWVASQESAAELSGGDYVELVAGGVLAAALSGAIGVGVGALVRNQVAAVVGVLVVMFVIDPTITFAAPDVAAYSIGSSTAALSGFDVDGALDWWVSGLVLLGWTTLFAVLGAFAEQRRDVT